MNSHHTFVIKSNQLNTIHLFIVYSLVSSAIENKKKTYSFTQTTS